MHCPCQCPQCRCCRRQWLCVPRMTLCRSTCPLPLGHAQAGGADGCGALPPGEGDQQRPGCIWWWGRGGWWYCLGVSRGKDVLTRGAPSFVPQQGVGEFQLAVGALPPGEGGQQQPGTSIRGCALCCGAWVVVVGGFRWQLVVTGTSSSQAQGPDCAPPAPDQLNTLPSTPLAPSPPQKRLTWRW